MGIPRTLSLHESALSPSEYSLYVSLFHDLVDPPDTTVGAREAKAYLRGRFPAVDGNSIDKILRVFHPALASVDQLLEGQFYAAMRLLSHVKDGKDVDPSLVFVQASEASITSLTRQSQGETGSKSTSTVSTPAPHNSNNPFTSRTTSATTPVNPPPRTSSNPSGTTTVTGRPFSNSISNSALSSDEGSMPDFVLVHPHSRASSSPAPFVSNPFVARANSIPQSMAVAPSLSQPALSTPTPSTTTLVPPALPPRKPVLPPPPRHASQQPNAGPVASVTPSKEGSVASAPARPYKEREPPLKPPKPPMHITASTKPPSQIISPLIKQGLEAANRAQRSAEHGLDKFRTWEIIKTSSNSTVNRVGTPSSGGARERERERASSVSSAEVSGTVKIHSTTRHARSVSRGATLGTVPAFDNEVEESPFDTPNNDRATFSPASPSSPDGVFGSSSIFATSTSAPAPATTVRVTRSKSMHAGPSPTTPPIPPPRRRRPESVQVTAGAPTALDGSPLFTPSPIKSSPWRSTELDEDSPFGDMGGNGNTIRKRHSTAGYGFGQSPSTDLAGAAAVGSVPTNTTDQSSTTSTSASSVTGGGSAGVGISGITASHFSTLQRQFQNLGMKTRPGLESARAKVEGKLVPGGYNKWGSESLTRSGDDSSPPRNSAGGGGGLGGFMPQYTSVSAASNGGVVSSGSAIRRPIGSKRRVGMGGGSEGSDEFEDADDVFSTDDDVRRNGWKPLRG
ncbi:hypothetical protein FRC17_002791 [Serendipita sp. 399]|nr:hypothetical protein FRC17_002791 [Serendipita sp. 399]